MLDRLSTLEFVGHRNTHIVDTLHAAEATGARTATAARAAVTAEQAKITRLAAAGRQIEESATEAEGLLRQLQRQQAQVGRAAAALGRQANATAAARRAFTAAPNPSGPPVAAGVSPQAARVAVATALAQLGKPYVWAAAGPNSFDCSGLTLYACAGAGIALPHFTGAQWKVGHHVGIGELRPGDLVFFYSTRHHMGMYLGGGNFIHAPHTGDVVRIAPMAGYWTQNYAGAVRVVG